MNKKCPKCGMEAKWVDNGPNLQYHYCPDCKEDISLLKGNSQEELLQFLDQDPTVEELNDYMDQIMKSWGYQDGTDSQDFVDALDQLATDYDNANGGSTPPDDVL